MSLITDQEYQNTLRDACNLVKTVADLKQQYIQNNNTISSLKTTVTSNSANNVFNANELIDLGQAIMNKQLIINKAASYRGELITFKSKVNNVDYENEIQGYIDDIDSVL